jgi:inner membrane protein
MDSLTHIALGAVIGEIRANKPLGKQSLLWGALFQSIPDIDFMAAFFLSPTDNLLVHRGITHSFLFGLLAALGLGYTLSRLKKTSALNFRQWAVFIGIEILCHLILDACNAYGVGWLEPFSDQRISFNIIFVADPMFSIWPGIAVIVLLLLPSEHKQRLTWATLATLLSSIYLISCLLIKTNIQSTFKQALTDQQIIHTRYFTTPVAFNNMLWYCVAETETGYYIAYRSIFDKTGNMKFTYFPQQRWLINAIDTEDEVVDLMEFSQGFYTIEQEPDALVFNVLRFGRVAGWESRETEFTFHYYLQRPEKNNLVVQRGRFAELNLKTAQSLFKRIKGE